MDLGDMVNAHLERAYLSSVLLSPKDHDDSVSELIASAGAILPAGGGLDTPRSLSPLSPPAPAVATLPDSAGLCVQCFRAVPFVTASLCDRCSGIL